MKRILIIDDDSSVRDSLKKVLEEVGYRVEIAVDGLEGAKILRHHHFDLLLLDLNLPGLNGWDLLDLTNTRSPTLPVVILTGMLNECEPGALLGTDAVLEKPPEVNLLLSTVARLLDEPPKNRLRRLEQIEAHQRPALPGSLSITPSARHS